MALENSTFGLLPQDYFSKEKTLASNATPAPKPLAKAVSYPMTNLLPGQVPQGITVAPTPTTKTVQSFEAPIPESVSKMPTTFTPSTVSIPTPPSVLEAQKAKENQKALEDQQKQIEDLTKQIQEKYKAPVPTVKASSKATPAVTPATVAPQPISTQNVMEPIDKLYEVQQNALRQQQGADTQFKKDQLSQQLAEMDQKGTGISNAFYRTLMRDQDSNFATSRRALTEDYLAKKTSILQGERSMEQARLDDARDQQMEIFMSIPDSNAALEFAKGMLEVDPENPVLAGLVNNQGYWKARQLESDKNWQNQAKEYHQAAMAAIDDPTKTDSQKESEFKDNMSKSIADVGFQAKSWAGSEQARQDLITALGKDAGEAAYSDLLNVGEDGLKDTFMDVLYSKAKKESENNSFVGTIKSSLPKADTRFEEQANDQILNAITKGNLAGVVQLDVDGSGNLKSFNFNLEKYGKEDGTISGFNPAEVPGLDIIFKDWDGNDYKGDYVPSNDPEDWMYQLDKSYQSYLDGFDKEKDGALLSRDAFKNAMTETDEAGNITVKSGEVKDLIKQVVAPTTSTGLMDSINKGELDPVNLTNEQFRILNADQELKGNASPFDTLPASGSDINKVNENFRVDKLNPPKIVTINGKLYKIKTIDQYTDTRKGKQKLRIDYVYEDVNGQTKTYTTTYIDPNTKIPSSTKNGIPIV